MTDRKSGIDDPEQAAHAWARFRRVLAWMGMATVVVVVVSLIALEIGYGPLSWVTIIATVFGLSATIMLAALLMGLIFLSSGTGYDETVDEAIRKREDPRGP